MIVLKYQWLWQDECALSDVEQMNKDSKCPRQFGRKTLACRIGSKHFLFVLKSRKVFWTVITETFGVNALWWRQSTKMTILSDWTERTHRKLIAEENKAKAVIECFRISLRYPPVLDRNCCWGGDTFGRATAQMNLCDTIVLLRS